MHFAEFGVVMMLFLIGLELRPSMLWRLRMGILGLGGVQVAATTLVVMAVLVMFISKVRPTGHRENARPVIQEKIFNFTWR